LRIVGEILAAENLSLAGSGNSGEIAGSRASGNFLSHPVTSSTRILSASVLGANASGFHDFGLPLTETREALPGIPRILEIR
jgi:hypothetical protein